MSLYQSFDDYDDFDAYSGYLTLDRRAHREMRGRQNGKPRPRPAVPDEILEQIEIGETFATTYSAGENEQRLLEEALGSFYRENVITDVLSRVKGGKEANVYCCQAHPNLGLDLVAAKIYRPRAHRTLRNDAIYKEGRLLLDEQGKGVVRDARLKRAVARKTDFGKEVMTFSWIEHEYDMMQTLHDAGADVPRPIGHEGNAILMEYFGEANQPAPTLNGVRLDADEARPMFERLLWHVELMLAHDRVHGDLSPYNVLYWQGKATVIDFPQAVVALKNQNAQSLLVRDIQRLADYFRPYGVEADPETLAAELWQSFMNGEL